MREIHQVGQRWKMESVDLEKLVTTYRTPLYVYSRAAIVYAWQQWRDAIARLPCAKETNTDQPEHKNRPLLSYAVKANSNLTILRLLNRLGAGFDVVSGGEIERVVAAGGRPKKIVFSGVGKTESELDLACTYNIGCINIESTFEFEALEDILVSKARAAGNTIDVAVRINPGVDAGTHAYITTGTGADKFGLTSNLALDLAVRIDANDSMRFAGLVSHIGSQICTIEPYARTLTALLDNALKLHEVDIATPVLGLGGGWGVSSMGDPVKVKLTDLTTALEQILREHPLAKQATIPALAFEPGRSIVAEAGLLLTSVIGLKNQPERRFAVVDAAMNDYIRPALYNAGNRVINISANSADQNERYDVVGPVCESGDFLAKDCLLSVRDKDVLAVLDTGAYGFSMSSNYNSRPRPAEVLIDEKQIRLIRERESIGEMLAAETRCLREEDYPLPDDGSGLRDDS